ncbi:MAG: hypothetical protein M1820_008736 [Bogoriella megaspora]|nr:MAG: hypothetical protein M1820_008736 [Bogoriella megaspora]
MAGMEQLVIHSKSYLVRWIQVNAGHSISWSLQPHKRSINFGIFKHPTATSDLTPHLPSVGNFDYGQNPIPTSNPEIRKSSVGSQKHENPVVEKLQGIGLKCVAWSGRCEAEKVSMGTFDISEGEGGMYGLVFDNTFSKQNSKKVTFVLMTYPSGVPPKSGHHLHFSQAFAGASTGSLAKSSPTLAPVSDSSEALPQDLHKGTLSDPRPRSTHGREARSPMGSTFYTGVLLKKRRKRNQGYARRFFSLDFTTSTLSYYRNRQSSALRGSVPLALAAVGVNEKSREISIDSGAEVWHLKASNKKDFGGWQEALEKAAHSTITVSSPVANVTTPSGLTLPARANNGEEREWAQAEALVGRVAGIRDAVRRLARDQHATLSPVNTGLGITSSKDRDTPSPSESTHSDYFGEDTLKPEKKPFWKRTPSSGGTSPSGLFRRSVSAQLAVPMPAGTQPLQGLQNGGIGQPRGRKPYQARSPDRNLSHHCEVVLRDLDSLIADFSELLNESKQRRAAAFPPSAVSRLSIDSMSTQEFFDAEDGDITSPSQILTIRRDSDASDRGAFDDANSNAPSLESDTDVEEDSSDIEHIGDKSPDGGVTLFPPKAKTLSPLPMSSRIFRRTTVPAAKVAPPSLIAFLRKNVGKDLSTIAMPVSANEPLSLLQRVSEQLEYTTLLDTACSLPSSPSDPTRLLYIAAFAISNLSNSRIKDRAIRKPFNPMLGETFELVREDLGFRFLAEKVSHRPVRIACQAESANWTFAQAPLPMQKFWGKSAELNTEGRARIVLHGNADKGTTTECYSYIQPTSFLKNIIAGEKYVEPTGTMTVISETTGLKAVATFKAGGMFSGRSEDVTIQTFSSSNDLLPVGLVGKWTTHLNLTHDGVDSGTTLWKTGALVPDASTRYGFTTFAASLNQITELESDKLPVTDSRLRPDQRAAEEGELDRAEGLKARLEERQRARRKVMEDHGDEWIPRWFAKVAEGEAGDETWRLKTGREGYWEERARGEWSGVTDVFR